MPLCGSCEVFLSPALCSIYTNAIGHPEHLPLCVSGNHISMLAVFIEPLLYISENMDKPCPHNTHQQVPLHGQLAPF